MYNASVQFRIKSRNADPRVLQNTQNLFNSRFAEEGKEINVQIFTMHVHSHCSAHKTFCLVTFSLPSSSRNNNNIYIQLKYVAFVNCRIKQ